MRVGGSLHARPIGRTSPLLLRAAAATIAGLAVFLLLRLEAGCVFTPGNPLEVARFSAILAIVAVGRTCLPITAELDPSVGPMGSCPRAAPVFAEDGSRRIVLPSAPLAPF